jgi:hypothetical protein
MPTCGLEKSASLNPTARSMARDGVCFGPSTTCRDQRRGSTSLPFFVILLIGVLFAGGMLQRAIYVFVTAGRQFDGRPANRLQG